VRISNIGNASSSKIRRLSDERFGNIDWHDEDKVRRFVFEEMPEKLRADEKVKNALEQGDPQNARIEVDRAVGRLVLEYMMDHTQLYKEFTSREDFRSFVVDKLFGLLSREKSG